MPVISGLLGLALMTQVVDASNPVPPPIINGVEATEKDYPMTGAMIMDATMVIYGYEIPFRMLVCSSTLIAPDVVLLAAHCVDPDAMTMGYGTLEDIEMRWTRQADLSVFDGQTTPDWPTDAVLVRDYIKHPQFDLMTMQMGLAENHDVALLFLDTPITDSPLGYLPLWEEGQQIAVKNEVDIVGWGQQTSDTFPPAGTYGYKRMGTSFIAEVASHEFQVGLTVKDVRKCHGDSGGPTFMDVVSKSTEPMRVVGVTSHSYDDTDCTVTGGVDTRVDAVMEWIDDEMTERCVAGTRSWCDVEGILPPPGLERSTEDTGVDTGSVDTDDTDETGAPDTDETGPKDTGTKDTDDTLETDSPTDSGDVDLDTEEQDKSGKCGCASSPDAGSLPVALLLLGGLALSRRRRS